MKMSTALLFLITLSFSNKLLLAQEKQAADLTNNISLLIGLNNTSFILDGERLDWALRPYVGFMYELDFSENIAYCFQQAPLIGPHGILRAQPLRKMVLNLDFIQV